MTELKLETNGIYKTKHQDLMKIVKIEEDEDRIHLFNITQAYNIYLHISRIKKQQLLTERIR